MVHRPPGVPQVRARVSACPPYSVKKAGTHRPQLLKFFGIFGPSTALPDTLGAGRIFDNHKS